MRCSFLDSKPVGTSAARGSPSAPAPRSNGVPPSRHDAILRSSGPSSRALAPAFHSPLGDSDSLKSVFILSQLDLELLHNYTTATCFSLSSDASKQQIWQVAVPREAVSHDFLLHALLAISAVNLCYVNPTERHLYERAAVTHRNLALITSIPALNEVTADNCHALFAMSSIISVLCFVLPYGAQWETLSDPVNDIVSVSKLICGVKTVLHSAREWIALGSLGGLVNYNWDPTALALPEEARLAFEKLFDLNKRETRDGSIRDLYNATIQDLKHAFEIHNVVMGEPGLVFTWLLVVQASYVGQLEKKEPMALVILAHYAVLLHTSNTQWWLEGRGARLVHVIHQLLPPEWLSAIDWPREAVRTSCEWKMGSFPLQLTMHGRCHRRGQASNTGSLNPPL